MLLLHALVHVSNKTTYSTLQQLITLNVTFMVTDWRHIVPFSNIIANMPCCSSIRYMIRISVLKQRDFSICAVEGRLRFNGI
uniref:Secreted protein n=1 Tax=Steinernema glaseri TaxID=37863 RepID=A0A1I7YXA3_9BILA